MPFAGVLSCFGVFFPVWRRVAYPVAWNTRYTIFYWNFCTIEKFNKWFWRYNLTSKAKPCHACAHSYIGVVLFRLAAFGKTWKFMNFRNYMSRFDLLCSYMHQVCAGKQPIVLQIRWKLALSAKSFSCIAGKNQLLYIHGNDEQSDELATRLMAQCVSLGAWR